MKFKIILEKLKRIFDFVFFENIISIGNLLNLHIFQYWHYYRKMYHFQKSVFFFFKYFRLKFETFNETRKIVNTIFFNTLPLETKWAKIIYSILMNDFSYFLILTCFFLKQNSF